MPCISDHIDRRRVFNALRAVINVVRMVRRFAILAAVSLSLSGFPVGGVAQAESPAPAVSDSREVWLQPVLRAGVEVDAPTIERMVDQAAAWVETTSGGRWQVTWGGVRPTLQVSASTCSALTREVALDRQRRAKDPSVTLYVGDARDCPYRGVAETPGSWVIVPHMTPDVAGWARTIAHELGHTIGLEHAGAETCAVLSSSSASRTGRCAVDEYGDRTDPMGRGSLDWDLGPLSRLSVGWASPDPIAGDGAHDVSLAPGEAVILVDPLSGMRYAIVYRAPAGDPGGRSRGVYLYRTPAAAERDVASVHLPWVVSPSDPWGGRPGMAFRAPTRALAVEVVSLTARQARVRILVDGDAGIKDTWAPTFVDARPALLRTGELQIPRAFDQAGISRYVVRLEGRVVRSWRGREGVESWRVRLPGRASPRSSVSVEVLDSSGNRSVTHVIEDLAKPVDPTTT